VAGLLLPSNRIFQNRCHAPQLEAVYAAAVVAVAAVVAAAAAVQDIVGAGGWWTAVLCWRGGECVHTLNLLFFFF
jgi:hypothetical protein